MTSTTTRPTADFLTYSHTIGLSAMQGRGFYYPSDTAIGKDGQLYTVNRGLEGDTRGMRVTVYDLDSNFFHVFSKYGAKAGEMIWPTAIALDAEGKVYVSDEDTNRINIFDRTGNFLSAWGAQGSDEGQLDGPSGLAFDRNDNLHVVDHRNHRVQRFTRDGRFISSFGTNGSADGQFNFPWGVTVDAAGEVYVADWRNDRIQRFTPNGDFLGSYGGSGSGDGELRRPSSIAVDADGYLYIADWGNERLQVLDPDGVFVAKYRGEATHSKWAEDFLGTNVEEAAARAKANLEPEMDFFEQTPYEESSHIEKYFWAPTSVKLDDAGRVYVTESNRHRLQIYTPGAVRLLTKEG
jgi:DNA-binding beta-propeller fold protein YncE